MNDRLGNQAQIKKNWEILRSKPASVSAAYTTSITKTISWYKLHQFTYQIYDISVLNFSTKKWGRGDRVKGLKLIKWLLWCFCKIT